MSLKSITVQHDPEKGCENCKFYNWFGEACRLSRRPIDDESGDTNKAEACAPSWCEFRKAPETVFDCPAGYSMRDHEFAAEVSAPLREERDEARANAKILAHAYEHDSRPPTDVVEAALAYPVFPDEEERKAPDKPVTREAILREAAEMMCSVCCWDGAPPQRQERPARWEHADGDTCPSGAIWEQIAKEHGPTTSEAGEKECPS